MGKKPVVSFLNKLLLKTKQNHQQQKGEPGEEERRENREIKLLV